MPKPLTLAANQLHVDVCLLATECASVNGGDESARNKAESDNLSDECTKCLVPVSFSRLVRVKRPRTLPEDTLCLG